MGGLAIRKHKFKKFVSLILTTIILISITVGCNSNGQNTIAVPDNQEAVGQGDTTHILFWKAGTDLIEDKYWRQCIARFEKENPHIKVALSSLPWGDDLESKLNAAYASKTGPDVLNYSIASIPQRTDLGQYEALDDYMRDWDGKEDISQNILDLGTYKGEVIGLGIKPDPRMFVWRKDMFKEVGLDPETPPKNWDELREYAEKLVIKTGRSTARAGFSFPIANGYHDFLIFMTQNGGDFIDEESNQLLYDSPQAIEALEYLCGFVQDGLTIPSDNYQVATDAFINGTSAMAYKNPSDIRSMIEARPELEDVIGMSGPLEKEKKSTFSGLGLMFMSKESQKKEAAWEFIKAVMSPEEMKIRAEELTFTVVRKSLEEDFIAMDPELNTAILGAIDVGRGAYKVPFSRRLNDVVSAAIEEAYYGQKTPEEALKESVKHFEKEIKTLVKD